MGLILRNLGLVFFASIALILFAVPVFTLQIIFNDRKNLADFFRKIAVNLDYVGGTLLYNTDAKTISAVTGKLSFERGGKFFWFEKFINWIFQDYQHCFDAYKKEFNNAMV